MTLRLAVAADVPALAALYAQAARTFGPAVYTPAQVQAWASFGADTPAFRDYVLGARTWVALDGDARPLAFCGVDGSGEVRSLYVRADATRQGRGSALLAHALDDARARGVHRFAAWVTPLSRPVFERAGFRLVARVTQDFQGVSFERLRVEGPTARDGV
ncbi:GNAT family N-acetyltransferase [Azohydromonas sediminis]|uniref:GNAT family N-acetyltransferase n=1 Tax=Azohydromonas sediminis TaxID=2259674 RepID=UPI000E6479BD|nr:GNAT family N-acetyltransferase [Azohydromonas sediminis]